MKMITDSLSEKSKKNWPEIYKKLTGKKWTPSKKDKRAIEVKLKGEENIDAQKRED
jgi:hypothetical protein